MDRTKARKGRLQVEIDVFTVLLFIAILVFSSISYYHETSDTFLESKKEMFDRDLDNIVTITGQELIGTPWFWSYVKEHGEDMTRPLTAEEVDYWNSAEADEAMNAFLEDMRNDYDTCDPRLQLLIARNGFKQLAADTDYLLRKFNYADISFMEFPREGEAYLYVRCTPDEPDPMMILSWEEYYATAFYTGCLTMEEYPVSAHPAVKEILNGSIAPGGAVYELWEDPSDGRHYCVGYKAVEYEDGVSCYVRILYDWTEYAERLNARMVESLLWGVAILLVFNGLLLFWIHRRATGPIAKVTNSVREYMEDKDSAKVGEAMSKIKVNNEIGVLADSFAGLTAEIDRYTNEILRLGMDKERIRTELSLAASIQEDAIPNIFPAFPNRSEFDLHASMDPAKEVGGDFYDFFMIDEDHLAMVIADVSGKGIPASLFMMSSKIIINDHATMGGTPAEILEKVNRQIYAANRAHMFVTVWLGILEISTGRLLSANAGHEYPIINVSGKYELLQDRHGLPIGARGKTKYTDTEILLKKGDSIFVYTDGVAEATNANDVLFGTDRTLEALNAIPAGASQKEVLAGVRLAVDAFVKEVPQFDDLTMLGLKYFGPDCTDASL